MAATSISSSLYTNSPTVAITLSSVISAFKFSAICKSFNKIESILNRGYLSKEKNEELFNKLLIDYNI